MINVFLVCLSIGCVIGLIHSAVRWWSRWRFWVAWAWVMCSAAAAGSSSSWSGRT